MSPPSHPAGEHALLALSSSEGTTVAAVGGALAVLVLAGFAWWWTRPLRSVAAEDEDPEDL